MHAVSERQEDSLRFTAALPSGDMEAKTGEVWTQKKQSPGPYICAHACCAHVCAHIYRHIHPLPVAPSPLIRPSTGGKHRSRWPWLSLWPEAMASWTMKWNKFIVRIPGDNDSKKLSPATQKPTCQDHPSHTSVMAPACPTWPALNNIPILLSWMLWEALFSSCSTGGQGHMISSGHQNLSGDQTKAVRGHA